MYARDSATPAGDKERLSLIPLAWAAGLLAAFGAAFSRISWPFVDVSSALSDARGADWPQTLAIAFGSDVEYRPIFRIATKAAYEWFGLNVAGYRTLVMFEVAAVLALVVWLLRPAGRRRAVAACIALSCVAGLHTSRILFAFPPVNTGTVVVILLLAAVTIAIDTRAPRGAWIFLPLVLLALSSLESGVIILPVLAVLWWARAPGVDRRVMVWACYGVAAYAVMRLMSGSVTVAPPFHTESGVGLSQLSPEDLQARFGDAPWLFWLYNLAATFLTVIASEPRSGVFAFAQSLLQGNTPYWQWVHIVSSVGSTIFILIALLVLPQTGRDRLLRVSGLAMLVLGSGLGAPYARDRMGTIAGVGYALLLYVTMAGVLERLPARGWRQWATAGCVVMIVGAWLVRSAEAFFQLRDTAWDFHHEWVERAEELDAEPRPDPVLVAMRTVALQKAPPDPRLDPTWSFVLFERRFPINAARPLSPAFDVRWKPEVTDVDRQRLEKELGLRDGEQVQRDPRKRTWSYRLRWPSRGRVQAILTHPAVEDTARIDVDRLEIQE